MQYLPAAEKNQIFRRLLRKAAREDLYSAASTLLPYRINVALPGARRSFEQVVIKDVHTLLALESVWATIRPKIIVLLRHPGAIAASWARLGLKGDFHPQKERLLEQGVLMEDYLQEFRGHMLSHDEFYFNVGVYWGAVYYVVQKIADEGGCGPCIFATHEYLCNDPLKNFSDLFECVGLKMTKRAEILLSEGDSKFEAEKWKKAVGPEELDAIMEGVRPFKVFERHY